MIAWSGLGLLALAAVMDPHKKNKAESLARRLRNHPSNRQRFFVELEEVGIQPSLKGEPWIPVVDLRCPSEDENEFYTIEQLQELLYDLDRGRVPARCHAAARPDPRSQFPTGARIRLREPVCELSGFCAPAGTQGTVVEWLEPDCLTIQYDVDVWKEEPAEGAGLRHGTICSEELDELERIR